MGGIQSTEYGRYGFHVLKVKENSPAYHAGMEQFFDYIVAINGISLEDGDTDILMTTLQQHKDKPLPLTIYSSKERAFREISLIPATDWSTDPNEKSLIGCSIRYCTYERAGEYVWHILDVSPNSPAEMAGIIPHTDYVIGSPQTVLKSDDDFYNLVEENLGKPLRLYVYNTEWDSCREVIIVPNRDWGGTGSLGCDVGFGLLHRIPRRKSNDNNNDDHDQEQYSNTIFSAADFEPTTDHSTNHSITSLEEGPISTPQQRSSIEETTTKTTTTDTMSNQQEYLLKEAQNTRLPDSPQVENND
ncbi:GRASP55/65 PDZ-like domain-containing protein [Halteromyces radiatus]|uniref:GRASP55/65 PDZ-like domain-containing protein n=1 Tax=Halteromyces radiatus TaxID=101107 RepID=UPI002220844B|nr:GRASP55/65 PDZ-like domain-containing protein [Halteromyces radiatus]KAI8085167.1 GRASP55/65 PDZ-like domain-containing protein [Halteromyces radiatus]